MSWIVGVDVGGTFTDFYAVRAGSGDIRVAKRPSTRDNPGRAVIEGLGELAEAGVPLRDVRRLAHGTTVATNAIIQRRGGKVVLLTTAGFRDLLEIGRQIRPHMYDLYRDQPPPLVPRERRLEVEERITSGGRVVRPLGEAAVTEAIARLGEIEADAAAVCLLFAFQNPEHEARLGAAIRAARPDLRISLSSEVQPEFREFERCSTTVLNAWLQPVMDEYMASLEAGLAERVPQARIGINQSNGGLMSPARARTLPVRTALSGPAAGVVGAIDAGDRSGPRDLITLDMGGTSADVSLVRDLKADVALERAVAGLPIRLPSIDVQTVGAGGGSIAWFDRDGLLKVGPQSAGAEPGPACYGRGGTAPTVTDANLLLGRLSARGLLGGRMSLDRDRAAEAFAGVAGELGYAAERAAHGVIGVVVANMVRAIRTISVERGHDPRDFTLVAFGGAGPLHARDVAAALGIRSVLVPEVPGHRMRPGPRHRRSQGGLRARPARRACGGNCRRARSGGGGARPAGRGLVRRGSGPRCGPGGGARLRRPLRRPELRAPGAGGHRSTRDPRRRPVARLVRSCQGPFLSRCTRWPTGITTPMTRWRW